MKENILLDKAERFAVRIVKLYKYALYKKHENVMSKQLLRAGTSIGANISEAECAQTQADFLAKLYIAYKECNETKYWIKLLHRTEYLSEKEFNSINKDCMELLKMLSRITKTLNNKIKNKAKDCSTSNKS